MATRKRRKSPARKRKSARKGTAGLKGFKQVSKSRALVKSGPKKGKLRKGCKFGKNGVAYCKTGATRRKRRR